MPMRLLQQGIDWWEGLEKKAKTIAAILTTIGVVAAGPIWMFTTFATASDLKSQMGDVKVLYVQSALSRARDKLFELQVKAKKQPLIDIELGRVRELEQEIKDLEETMRVLRSGK